MEKDKRHQKYILPIPTFTSKDLFHAEVSLRCMHGLDVGVIRRPEGEFLIRAVKINKYEGPHGRRDGVPRNILAETEGVDFNVIQHNCEVLAMIQGALHEIPHGRTLYMEDTWNFTKPKPNVDTSLQTNNGSHIRGLVQETAFVLLRTNILDAWISSPGKFLSPDAKNMYVNLQIMPTINVSVNKSDQYVVT